MMWLRHWGIAFDPFRAGAVPFVATPEHEEAVARLVHLIENGERRAGLRGEAGSGKSAALDEALGRLRRPGRRIVPVRRPADGLALLRGLLGGLGLRIGPAAGRSEATGRLLDAARVAHAQGIGVVVAVDDDGLLDAPEDARVIDRIEAVFRQAGGRASVVVVGRGEGPTDHPWALSVRLGRLTRSMAEDYLLAKLRAAGREGPAFSGRAVLRLHARSGGLPAAIDRLAGLALRAGAVAGREEVGADLVDEVARECAGMVDLTVAPS